MTDREHRLLHLLRLQVLEETARVLIGDAISDVAFVSAAQLLDLVDRFNVLVSRAHSLENFEEESDFRIDKFLFHHVLLLLLVVRC